MGDYARREMIVRITRVIRQNPAYRLIATAYNNLLEGYFPEVVRFKRNRKFTRMTDHRKQWIWPILSFVCVACGGRQISTPSNPEPISVPTSPPTSPPIIASNPGPWSFSYTPGSAVYRIMRSAKIERTDSAPGAREVSTNLTHESLTLESTNEGLRIVAVVDSFASTTQELMGRAQAVQQLPVQLTATLVSNTLTIPDDSTTKICSTVNSVLLADLHNLAVPFPAPLTPGLKWQDTVNMEGCQAGIPTLSKVSRTFTVTGEVNYQGQTALIITRTDTAHLQGEGGLQQHHLLINADGTGTATYYLDTQAGRIFRLTVDQNLNLELTSVASKSHFKQDLKQEFTLIP